QRPCPRSVFEAPDALKVSLLERGGQPDAGLPLARPAHDTAAADAALEDQLELGSDGKLALVSEPGALLRKVDHVDLSAALVGHDGGVAAHGQSGRAIARRLLLGGELLEQLGGIDWRVERDAAAPAFGPDDFTCQARGV